MHKVRNYKYPEIVKITEKEFEINIKGNKFEFETHSKDYDKKSTFIATVNDLNLSYEGKPFSFKIKIENEQIEKELNILNIKQIKYVL